MPSTPTLNTRKPTGAVPWPFVLLEGEEKAGKTYAAAALSASPKVGRVLWLDLGEGSADEYGALEGADYEVIEHDGTYAQVLNAVLAAKAVAAEASAKGEPPVVLVVDTLTNLWDGLKDWASDRAKGSASNRKRLAEDPNAEIKVSTNLWNDAGARHKRIMTALLTFPGIVIATARGKEVVEIGPGGAPVEGSKVWKVEGHKNLPFDATCWVRLRREHPALVVGLRSLRFGVRPGKDPAKDLPEDWTLEWLVFEALGCDPAAAHVRDVKDVTGGALTPEEAAGDSSPEATSLEESAMEVWRLAHASMDDLETIRRLFDTGRGRSGLLDVPVPPLEGEGQPEPLGKVLRDRGLALVAAAKAVEESAPAETEPATA